jgi:serine/threonine-protein kinase RsbW
MPSTRAHCRARSTSTCEDGGGRTSSARRATRGGRVLRFEIVSARTAVGPAVERVLRHVASAGLNESQTANLAIALSEALANAVIHGNGLDPHRQVFVRARVTPGREATVEIRDCGPGFDHARLRDPTSEQNVLLPRGRGIFLMRHLVDDIEYKPPGNCVCLIVRNHKDHG